jgi:Baseplate J-like protein
MDQVIKLGRDDHLLQVHSQVEWSAGRRVIVVVPRGAKALNSEFGLRLVRRWADETDVLVALVTNDLTLQELADEAGLPYFPSIGKAQSVEWKWPHNGKPILSHATALDEEESPPKVPLLQRLGLTGFHLVLTLLLFSGAASILALAAILLIPAARITIIPAPLTVSDSREVILDPTVTTIDQINGILPFNSIRREISGTASLATTKLNTAPADPSTGQAVFTNLTGTPAEIPLGTIVETSSGVTVRFSTTARGELPSGYNARITLPIQAVDPGPTGNVKPLQINVIEGPLSAVVRVINTASTSGGTIKQVHVVTLDDKTLLRQRLEDELRAAAITKLQNDAGSDLFVPPASVQVSILGESFDHLVDDPAENLSLHVEAVATGAAVDPTDLQTFAQRVLGDKLPKDYLVLPGTLRVEPDVNARAEANSVILRLNSSEKATPNVNNAMVLEGLNGKTIDQAESLIGTRLKLARPPEIEITPSWWRLLPYFDFRIAFFVQPESVVLAR